MMRLLHFLLLSSLLSSAQLPMRFGMGNAYKNGNGTLYLSVGYKPVKQVELFVAPSGGLFFGGLAIFYGSKVAVLSKYRLYPNLELTYRHSHKRGISYENHDSKKTESFWAASADYLVSGLGVNYRFMPKNGTDFLTISLSATYSYAMGNYKIRPVEGPFSEDGERSAQSTLDGGFGFTVSFFTDVDFSFKKKQKEELK